MATNAMAASSAGKAERSHDLVIIWGNRPWSKRPYWECSCHAARHLPVKKDEIEEAGLKRARESHARHQAKELSR